MSIQLSAPFYIRRDREFSGGAKRSGAARVTDPRNFKIALEQST